MQPKALMTPARDDLDMDISSMRDSSSRHEVRAPDESDTYIDEHANVCDETTGYGERRQQPTLRPFPDRPQYAGEPNISSGFEMLEHPDVEYDEQF